MRKVLAGVGGIFVILLVIGSALFAYAAYRGQILDKTSKEFVDANVPLIVSTWSKEALLSRASPQFLRVANAHPEQIDGLFQKLSALGSLLELGEFRGNSNVSYNMSSPPVTTASYSAKARFQNGEALITVRLISISGEWRFRYFHVDSPLFVR